MAWTTVDEVATRTGKAVTAATVTQAQAVLEAYLGLDETDSEPWLKARDLKVLGRATQYQAAYLHDHPEVLTAQDLVAFSQPDLSVTLKHASVPTAPRWLSPLAAMTLRQFKYAGPRSIQLESEITSPALVDDDDADDLDAWQPI